MAVKGDSFKFSEDFRLSISGKGDDTIFMNLIISVLFILNQ